MKVKDYFKQAAVHEWRFFQRLSQGVYYAFKRFFTQYPNPTWIAITAIIVLTSVIQIGHARSERDEYGRENARLQHQLDSVQHKEIRFNKTALWN